jgi:hypothetical protein
VYETTYSNNFSFLAKTVKLGILLPIKTTAMLLTLQQTIYGMHSFI